SPDDRTASGDGYCLQIHHPESATNERDGESKTILSAHLSLIQDDEFAGNIRRLMTEQHQATEIACKFIILNQRQMS
ncbi:hypothetical protein PSY44_23910, partial [Shigella flexneri]|nr:hypothetical protein [Shigella flexneri]